ncbi:hypothetical protein MKX01_017040, partial [Papaver californicum]
PLLANMDVMYAVYQGPEGLKVIAQRVHGLAGPFAHGLKKLGTVDVQGVLFFDTVEIKCADAHAIADAATKSGMNLRNVDSNNVLMMTQVILWDWVAKSKRLAYSSGH